LKVEWINVAYFALLIALAWTRFLLPEKRIRATAFGILGFGLACTSLVLSTRWRMPAASVIRDWLPALLILLAYWQAGQFFVRGNEQLQRALVQFDEHVFHFLRRHGIRFPEASAYFEFSYLFCYPMVPLGIWALYLLHLRDQTDQFWMVVLPASYACYIVLPFVQVLPPWMFGGHENEKGGSLQRLNLQINRHLSIRVDTFPSAHVATSLAIALALLRLSPMVGLLFLWLALNIAIAAVVRRYHYVLDVLLGAAVALLAFLFNLFLQIR
jgi:membrane-associated phospholipid phosphatase